MTIAYLTLTNLGRLYIPPIYHGISKHYGLIVVQKNQMYTHILTSDSATQINKIWYENKAIHIPNINGEFKMQYFIKILYKINEKLFNLSYDKRGLLYLQEHYSKFGKVLAELNKANENYLAERAIDLLQNLPPF